MRDSRLPLRDRRHHLPNEASVALHLALGFVHVGTVREAGWKLDAWHDVAFYQRRLGSESRAHGAPRAG